MKAIIEIEMEPFSVPKYVDIKAPKSKRPEVTSLHVSALSEEALTALCSDFRLSVFKAAGKQTPAEKG